MMIPFAVSLALSLQTASVPGADQLRYEGCVTRIAEAPEAAHDDAIAWRLAGGGWPARHCEALAVTALGNYAEGAQRLIATAEAATGADLSARAAMLGQAGDAWRLAGEEAAALEAFEAGLQYAPGDAGLMIGIAQSLMALGRAGEAETAAARALARHPEAAEAWRVRAEARLAAGDLDGARSDVEQARELAPDNIAILKLLGDVILAARRAGSADGR